MVFIGYQTGGTHSRLVTQMYVSERSHVVWRLFGGNVIIWEYATLGFVRPVDKQSSGTVPYAKILFKKIHVISHRQNIKYFSRASMC